MPTNHPEKAQTEQQELESRTAEAREALGSALDMELEAKNLEETAEAAEQEALAEADEAEEHSAKKAASAQERQEGAEQRIKAAQEAETKNVEIGDEAVQN